MSDDSGNVDRWNQRLTAKDDQWKVRASGFPGRGLDHWIVCYADFVAAQSAKFEPWRVFQALVKIFGDHRVAMSSYAPYKELVQTPFPWRKGYYRAHVLKGMASWFAERSTWEAMGGLARDNWCFHCYRGGGSTHHQVWSLSWIHSLDLEFATRDVPDDALDAVDTLMNEFARTSLRGGAYFGFGGVVVRGKLHGFSVDGPRGLFGESLRRAWEDAPSRERPIVPDVTRFMILDRSRVARAGGIEALKQLAAQNRNDLLVKRLGGGALITLRPIQPVDVRVGARSDLRRIRKWREYKAARALFRKAHMLSDQQVDWWREHERRLKEERERPVPSKARDSKPSKTMAQWLKQIQRSPPRFLASCAQPAERSALGTLGRRFAANTAWFSVVGPTDRPGLTLYGERRNKGEAIGGRVLAGSLDPARATFEFDPRRDGWDGEANEPSPFGRENTERRLSQLSCPHCDARHFRCVVVLEYPDDLDELEPHEQRRASDFFTWLWLVTTCAACEHRWIAADIECA